ncbi:MAG: hypothetical protein ACRDAM_15130 [Casimicrobium sp.]
MSPQDFDRFKNAMNGAWLSVTNGKEKPANDLLDVFWAKFRNISIEDFERAIDSHLLDPKHGMFVPKPADVARGLIAVNQDDGRPDPDEAWGIALQAMSESATIVWTPDIRAAWAAAEPVIQEANDKVGARKTFISTYERIVERARTQGEPLRWETSLGSDVDMRVVAIEQAQRLNRVSNRDALAMIEMVRPLALPAPGTDGAKVIERLHEVRRKLAMGRATRQAEIEAQATEEMKRGAQRVGALVGAQALMPKS